MVTMGEDLVKHDIKVSFLITNTLNALVGGLFPLSFAAGLVLAEGFIPPVVPGVVVGAPIAGLSALGFYAAFLENRKYMNAFSALTGLTSAAEVVAMFVVVLPPEIVVFGILHASIALAAVTTALYLAKHMNSETQKSPSSGLVRCFRFFGYCVIAGVVGWLVAYFT